MRKSKAKKLNNFRKIIQIGSNHNLAPEPSINHVLHKKYDTISMEFIDTSFYELTLDVFLRENSFSLYQI